MVTVTVTLMNSVKCLNDESVNKRLKTDEILLLVTHRRSVAKRGGCFQRRLFVSLFVRTITYERLNVGAVMCIVQKSRPSLNFKVKGQRSRLPGTKNALIAADTPGCVRMVCARCKQRATAQDGPISLPGGVVRLCRLPVLRGWKNQRMLTGS